MNKLDEAKQECKKLEKLKYDGIAGKLPSWIPEPIKREFEILRLNLFVEAPTNFGPAEILRSYKGYEDMLDGKGCQSMFPPQFHDKFDTLTRIREVVRLGPERGLSYWVGEKVSKDIKRGKKILSSAKKGHEEIYGTKKEKQERYKKYQKAIDELNHKNEKLSFTELSNRVGRHFGKSPRTIRNHTTPPKKR
jgi:hypothetical protein